MARTGNRLAALAIFTACALALGAEWSEARTVEKVVFEESYSANGTTLPLRNAALLRYLKVIRAYVAALYLPEGLPSTDALLDVPKRLELSYLVSIKGSDFGKGAAPVLERNLGARGC